MIFSHLIFASRSTCFYDSNNVLWNVEITKLPRVECRKLPSGMWRTESSQCCRGHNSVCFEDKTLFFIINLCFARQMKCQVSRLYNIWQEINLYFKVLSKPDAALPSLNAHERLWTEIPHYTLFRSTSTLYAVTNRSEQRVALYQGLTVVHSVTVHYFKYIFTITGQAKYTKFLSICCSLIYVTEGEKNNFEQNGSKHSPDLILFWFLLACNSY